MGNREERGCKCSKCGKEGMAYLYHRIEGKERKAAADGSLFRWECPECGAVYRFLYPCFFVDEKRKYVIRFQGGQEDIDFEKEFEGYIKRDCKTQEEFSEKIRMFQAGYDDRAMELLKLITFAKVHLEDSTLSSIYFYRRNQKGNLDFTIFRGEEPDGIEIRGAVYDNIRQIVEDMPTLPDKFICIDGEWAGKQITGSEMND